jgi:hypothetical protein
MTGEGAKVSNLSVLENLGRELEDYLAGGRTGDEMGKRLEAHIEALEGIPYSVLLEMRHFRYRLEIGGMCDDENSEFNRGEVVSSLQDWVRRLMGNYAS